MFNEWRDRTDRSASQAEFDQLIATEEELLNEHCRAFRTWWTTERATGLVSQCNRVTSPVYAALGVELP